MYKIYIDGPRTSVHCGPPPVCRRRQSKYGWSLCEKVTEPTDFRLVCTHVRFGWFWNMNTSMLINLKRSWPLRQRSDVAGIRCGVGLNNRISITAAKTGRPPMSAPRLRRWNARRENYVRQMRFSARPQRILHRRSSPARSNDDRFHRRAPQ